MGQNERVLQYMKEHGTITAKEAMDNFGCMRLASRISDIRKMGININREMITVKNRYDEDVRVAQYSIGGKNGISD